MELGKVTVCTSLLSQTFGLMFRRKQNIVMVFKTPRRVSLHMWFVFYPIDVLLLDKEKRIVEVKRGFKPFTFWTSQRKGCYLVEQAFPTEYRLGEKISWKI